MQQSSWHMSSTLIGICLFLCVPGCMIVGQRDRYTYDDSASSSSGAFCPYTYLRENTQTVPLPPFRIENEALPHDLVMLKYDQTYLQSDEGFERFVVDTMSLEFANGETVMVLSPDTPLSERTFVIPKGKDVYSDNANRVFEGVITQRDTFTLKIAGKAIRESGESIPFASTTTYRYDGRDQTFHTIFDEWASC